MLSLARMAVQAKTEQSFPNSSPLAVPPSWTGRCTHTHKHTHTHTLIVNMKINHSRELKTARSP